MIIYAPGHLVADVLCVEVNNTPPAYECYMTDILFYVFVINYFK